MTTLNPTNPPDAAATPDSSTRPVVVPAGTEALVPFIDAGLFGTYEVQFVATVLRLRPGLTDHEVLALAIAARAPLFGHVCTTLVDIAGLAIGLDGEVDAFLPWPDGDAWAEALAGSEIVSDPDHAERVPIRPLVWDGHRLYLQRYWHYERVVADDLRKRSSAGTDRREVEEVLVQLFGPDRARQTHGPDLQRQAVRRGMRSGVSIIAGGPGTGKTYTVARLLAAVHLVAAEEGRELRVALAAPTGKAAARMGDAVKEAVSTLEADGAVDHPLAERLVQNDPTTVHSLLGWRDRTHFRHDRDRPLPHDVVIVDETSMVSLPLMAKLLDAVRPAARLVLVGDPFQLASIEAGTVMSDVVGPTGDSDAPVATVDAPLHGRITVLTRLRRFGEGSAIAALAEAVRQGDGDAAMALLDATRTDVRWVRPDDAHGLDDVLESVVADGVEMVTAAQRGDASAALAAADRIKVLSGTRRGPLGMDDWTGRIEIRVGSEVDGFRAGRRWQPGRPVLITANDKLNRVFNGDAGVVVGGDGVLKVAFRDGDDIRYIAPSRLHRVETWWAMTIHKSQGSEFAHAVVSLPQAGSPILTRELVYTAVTRAREQLTIVGTEAALRAAIQRPVARASGLGNRLWPS